MMSEILLGQHNGTSIGVSCTWGDGPDVAANIRFDPKILDQYTQGDNVGFLPLDLTADEALEIGLRFSQAGAQAKRMVERYRKNCGGDA